MQSKITQQSPTRVRAEVIVDWDKAAPHYRHSIKEIQNHANIPGFRKGKAPAALLKRRFRDEITQEMAKKIVPDSISEMANEQDIKMVGLRYLLRAEFKENESFTYEADIDILPSFELQPYSGIEVESLKVKVEKSKVDHELEHMIEHAASKTPVDGRPVQENDAVKLDLTVLDRDASETLLDVQDYEIRLGDQHAHPELSKAVLGMNQGDMTELEFVAADDDPFVSWRGKNVKAYIEVLEIAEQHKPKLDDEFAKSKGHDDLKALRKDVEKQMRERLESQEKDRMTAVIMSKVIEAYDFEVPESMVREQAEDMLNEQLRPIAHILKQNPIDDKTLASLFESMIPQAEQSVRMELVLKKIAEDLGLEPSEEDLSHELQHLAEHHKTDAETLRTQLESDGRMENVKWFLNRKAAMEAIVSKAKVVKVDALTEESNDETEAEQAAAEEKPKKKKRATKKPAKQEADTAKSAKATSAKSAKKEGAPKAETAQPKKKTPRKANKPAASKAAKTK